MRACVRVRTQSPVLFSIQKNNEVGSAPLCLRETYQVPKLHTVLTLPALPITHTHTHNKRPEKKVDALKTRTTAARAHTHCVRAACNKELAALPESESEITDEPESSPLLLLPLLFLLLLDFDEDRRFFDADEGRREEELFRSCFVIRRDNSSGSKTGDSSSSTV